MKTISLGKGGTPATTAVVTVFHDGAAYGVVQAAFGIGVGTQVFNGFWVLQPGWQLRMSAPDTAVTIYASGAELEGVAD